MYGLGEIIILVIGPVASAAACAPVLTRLEEVMGQLGRVGARFGERSDREQRYVEKSIERVQCHDIVHVPVELFTCMTL